MSTTRLLVLGTVRLFQPAHGYLVRRELISWDVESWAAVNPGSIYNMLRTLTRDALLEEAEPAGRGGGPGRVRYRLTMDGESAYHSLLGRAVWEVDGRDPHLVAAAVCFLPTMTRERASKGLEARQAALDLRIRAIEARSDMLSEKRLAPPHSAEVFQLEAARYRGELEWVRAVRDRIAAGHYRFAGEPGADEGPRAGRWYGALDEPAKSR